jgi:hypothetical protein
MSMEMLQHYWGARIFVANALTGLRLVGALLFSLLFGDERSYRGRAAACAPTASCA